MEFRTGGLFIRMIVLAAATFSTGCGSFDRRESGGSIYDSAYSPDASSEQPDVQKDALLKPRRTNGKVPPDGHETPKNTPIDGNSTSARMASQRVKLTAAQQELPTSAVDGEEVKPAPDSMPDSAQSIPVKSGRETMPIDFQTALMLTEGQNPRIAFTQFQIDQAFAQYQAARVMWLPSLRAGMNYNKHEGRIQDVVGNNIDTSRGAAFGGMGAGAVGAGSPSVPGLLMQFHLTDAIYQQQIRAASLRARRFESDAALNDQLLETSLAYLTLLSAHQQRAIAEETSGHGEELAKLTVEFARTGEGSEADADRAAALLALLRNDVVRAEENIEVSSSRLAQLISEDPTIVYLPQEPTIVPIDLVGQECELNELVATGLSNRPELAASRSLVTEAVNRLRRETHAPWLPSIALGASYGGFAAGTGGEITNGADRFDFDAIAWWEVRNLGFSEGAARNSARAQIQSARMREIETMDLVAREIAEAHAQVESRKRQIRIAEMGIESAQQSYARNLERIKNGQGLPIEAVQSIQALDAARRDYLRSVVDYNTSQFRLQRALGWPISQR
jgi:outer membrane protein TolC